MERCLSCSLESSKVVVQRGDRPLHIGIHTSAAVLEDKLEQRHALRRREATWSINRLPQKLSKDGPNYLYMAVDGYWQGYFVLSDEVLWNPEDERCPYALLFDTRSWVRIKPIQTRRFRGFTYNTPNADEVRPIE